MEETDARKLSTDSQQLLRYQVIRLRKQGRKHSEISAITGISHSTCSTWWTLYKNGGNKTLYNRQRGRPLGSCHTLSPEQEKNMRDRCPDQLKLLFTLWTRIAVQQLIKQLWAIDMPIRTVGEYLKRWGFSPQKPLRRAYKQNPEAVRAWLNAHIQEFTKGLKRKMPKFIGL